MPHDDDELSPEEQQVRRLLADARHIEPMPDDVAARLSGVLADLRQPDVHPAERALARPVDLATARRRRNARTWLVAAAVVVAAGVGLSHLDLSTHDDADGGSSASADSGRVAADAPSASPLPGRAPDDFSTHALVPLDPDRFGAQLQRLRTRLDRNQVDDTVNSPGALVGPMDGAAGAAGSTASSPGPRYSSAAPAGCLTQDHGRGRTLAVTYGGRPGVLVFRPARGDTQVVDLFLCGHDDPERSITLPTG